MNDKELMSRHFTSSSILFNVDITTYMKVDCPSYEKDLGLRAVEEKIGLVRV